MHQLVLDFWFRELSPKQWWGGDADLDALVTRRFSDLLMRAAAAELSGWRGDAHGRLAEIIVLDQFSRNVYRGTARAFAQDPIALALAQEAISVGALAALSSDERSFLLLPYMHSESRHIHLEAERLFREFAPGGNYDFELRHKAIIDRFGRYPHRNKQLGRISTDEELVFLSQPGSGF